MTHDIPVVSPGVLRVEVRSNAQPFMPLILAYSSIDPSGAAIMNVPGLGIVNIGTQGIPLPSSITILGDGIGRTVNPLTDALYVTDAGVATPPKYVWTVSCYRSVDIDSPSKPSSPILRPSLFNST